jgi:hypothetical protein
MKRILIISFLLSLAITLTSLKIKDSISHNNPNAYDASSGRMELELKKFDYVSVCCGINLHLKAEETGIFYAEGADEHLDKLQIEYKGKTLYIKRKNEGGFKYFKGDWKGGRIDVYLSSAGMTGLSASSGSNVENSETYKTGNLDIDISSGANINLKLNVDNLNVESSSGSSANISGIALDAEFDSSSGSSCNAKTMSVYKSLRTEASSGSSIQVTAHGKVWGDASSGGSIEIYGYPHQFDKDESSGGSVVLLNKK